MQPESPPSAPAVVAVVVACDPGPWFDEVLASLAAQDYPNLSVLVIDVASRSDPTPAVAAALPGAFVRRIEHRVGFGTAANEALGIVEGASHYLICHDDVVLAPDAVRLLVEEAFRSNAGVATPKFVAWEDPSRLLAVGMTTDRVGVLRNPVEPGELDQEQHDAVRDVLVAPGGVTLVRADLFSALGGFDPGVDSYGEDIDLSWRARLAGARLTAVPSARVRHLQATVSGERRRMSANESQRRAHAHRYRTLLKCYRLTTLLAVLPVALFWAAGEALTLAVQGRPRQGWPALGGIGSALRSGPSLRTARRRVQKSRLVPDSAILGLQARGNTRFRLYLQAPLEDVRQGIGHALHRSLPEDDAGWDSGSTTPGTDWYGGPVADAATGSSRSRLRGSALVWVAILFVLLLGSRSIIGAPLPRIGSLPDTSGGWSNLWSTWWSAWQPSGLGVAAPASPALALLGVLGTVLVGAVGTLEHVVVLAPLVIGPFGAWRAARAWRSATGRLAAGALYAVVPLPYDDLARGHWGGLVAWAAAPWVLASLARLSATRPFLRPDRHDARTALVGVGLLSAVVAGVAPAWLWVVPLAGLGMAVGGTLASGYDGAASLIKVARPFLAALMASVVAVVLLIPWSPTVLDSSAAMLGPSAGPAGRLGLGHVLTFHAGPFGGSWQWVLLVAAALPLFIGKDWRFDWAARSWGVASVCFAVAWAGSRGWLPALPPALVLAPAAAALAMSAALGAAAFEMDLPAYRFGWRQVAAAVAGMAVVVGFVAFAGAAGGGRWGLPSGDDSSIVSALAPPRAGDYRVLWVGAPTALPLASRTLSPGFAYATSYDGDPSLADQLPTGPAGAAPVLAGDLRLAEGRRTSELGHLLAPAGVLFLVVPNHLAPSGSGAPAVPVPGGLLSALAQQIDLRPVNVGDANFTVYENAAWAPVRSVLPARSLAPSDLTASAGPQLSQAADLAGARPLGAVVAPGSTVYVGSTFDRGWTLQRGNASVKPAPAFGFAMAFPTVGPGGATGSSSVRLAYSAPLLLRLGDVVEILLWLAAVALLMDGARRRDRPRREAPAEWFAAAGPPRGGPAR